MPNKKFRRQSLGLSTSALKATKQSNKTAKNLRPINGRKAPSAEAAETSGITRLLAVEATAKRLWQEAVAQRTPAVIEGHLQDSSWQAAHWTNAYLQSKAGAAKVMVEQQGGNAEGFGKGRKVSMTFSQFIDQLRSGSNSLYLTTQEAEVSPEGQPGLMGPPVSRLQSDFPLRPQCMGQLVPQSINMWMGATAEGTSSGLHHDFHDNLYILLRGQKHFRLFPPSEAPRMYTNGKLNHIHTNGRIVYEGQGDVAADGSHPGSVRRWQKQIEAEQQLQAAEEAVKRKDKGSKARLAKAEQALEMMLDARLGLPSAGQGGVDDEPGSDDSWPCGLQDDYIDSDAEAAANSDDSSNAGASDRRPKQGILESKGKAAACASNEGQWEEVVDDSHPDSFSQVDLSRPLAEIQTQFPLFPGVQNAWECELRAGQMLYLPCGWFHEVRSYGSSQEGGHLALNYWFHPPDNTDPSEAGMRKPYRCQYWPAQWVEK